jgi:hypothetical protein
LRLWLVLVEVFALAGCTQDFSVFEGDASVPTDGPASDGGDASMMKEAGNETGPAGDAGLVFQCNGGTVSDCSTCSGMPEPCVFCSTANSSTLAGLCQQPGTSCFGAAPNGFALCACGAGNPSSCPRSYQVCRNGSCRTCAESINNANYTCNGGGKCNPADGGCS